MFIIENVITEKCNLACHYCVDGNTKILMHDNTTKMIKDIKVGDKIISIDYDKKIPKKELKYNITTVTGLTKPRFVEKIYHVITEDGNELYITGEHPVLTTRHKWKPIKDIIKSKENIVYTIDLPVFNDNENYSLKKPTKIKYAEEIDFNDFVYNIETETHNYIANNIIVHNCYMNNNPIDMTFDTFKTILSNLDNVLKIYKQENYHLDFFGGEPLLNWDLIKKATPMLQEDKRCKSFGIISNLLELDEEKVQFIQENNINVSFSFDGLWNEYNRPLKNGSSSLKEYEKKKDLIKEVSPYGCKVMVAPSSLGTMVDNIKYLVDEWGFINPDYSLVRDDIWSEEDIENFRNEIRDLSNLQIEYIKKGKDVLIGFFKLYLLDMILGKKFGKRPFGCFAGHHGMGIMPNGIGYPCARFGTNRVYPLYDFNTNYFYEGIAKIFLNQKNTNPQTFEKCQHCYLYNYCNAGCTYSQMKNGFKPIDSVCKLYKILYDECLYIFDEIGTDERFIQLLYPNNLKK